MEGVQLVKTSPCTEVEADANISLYDSISPKLRREFDARTRFLGRYRINDVAVPVHESATCRVHFATAYPKG